MRTPLKSIARAAIIRPLLAATLGLAITFTLGCPNTGNGDEPSSSSADNPSSSGTAPSSSSGTPPSSSSPLPLSSSQAQAIVPVHGDPITDSRDGKTYETVVIGTQTWMAKNLDYETETGSKCYNDNSVNCMIYGRLYNWETAMNACPAGWHVPSDMEWVVLEDFIGGGIEAVWKKLKAKSGWYQNGTDDYGFAALPIGSGNEWSGVWWTATEIGTDYTYYRNSDGNKRNSISGMGASKSDMFSLRCLKGSSYLPPSSPSYTPVSCPQDGDFCDDRDGKSYKNVTIDGKTWMAKNLAFNAEGSKCYAEGVSGVSADSIAKNCETYGRLYDWSTAMAFESACNKADCSSYIAEKHKGICPKGWHLPSKAEWDALVTFASGTSTAGYMLKAKSGWTDLNGNAANGIDQYGFSALPGGFGLGLGYGNIGISGNWWSTEASRLIMSGPNNSASSDSNGKSSLYSLRCVMD